jgi:hypothetical protein
MYIVDWWLVRRANKKNARAANKKRLKALENDTFFQRLLEEFRDAPLPALTTMHGGGERCSSFRSKSVNF